MHVVGPRQLDTPPYRSDETATLDERGRDRKTEEREPCEHQEVDAREDPQARDADRQEGDEARRECHGEMAAAADRLDERQRTGVRRAEDDRSSTEHDRNTRRTVQLCGRDGEEGGADPKR